MANSIAITSAPTTASKGGVINVNVNVQATNAGNYIVRLALANGQNANIATAETAAFALSSNTTTSKSISLTVPSSHANLSSYEPCAIILYLIPSGSSYIAIAEQAVFIPAPYFSAPASIASGGTVNLYWNNYTESTRKITKSVNGGAAVELAIGVGTANFSDTNAGTAGQTLTYTYTVTRSNAPKGSITITKHVTVTAPAPPVPGSITYASSVNGGSTLPISWGSSSGATRYHLERQVDGGSWTEIYQGTSTSYTDSITSGWGSVTYRVRAYNAGGYSSYRTGSATTVINNSPPVISGTDGNIGTFSTSFSSRTYTVTDANGGTVTVVERLDGVLLRSYNATLGATNTLSFTAAAWQKILNGPHTITITATDSAGASATRTWTFTKAVTSLLATLSSSLPADAMPTMGIIDVSGNFPTGCVLKVEVCNNGNDASPSWQDISAYVADKRKFLFTNTTKTASTWGVKIRATLSRGTAAAGTVCSITSIGGNYK